MELVAVHPHAIKMTLVLLLFVSEWKNCSIISMVCNTSVSIQSCIHNSFLAKGTCVNNPGVRLPYSKIKEYGIQAEGLPDNKDLKHPSSYGKRTLQAILDNSDFIKIKGKIHIT